jgi:hypothetical protein
MLWNGSTKRGRPETAITPMKYPTHRDFQRYFKHLPWWVIPLILLLIFGRFLLLFLFQH